jgi:uroporphyrinogen decarboxylase
MIEAAPYVGRALGMLKHELGGRIPVLGFAGAPWTLAAYLLQGEGHEGFPAVKGLLYQDPAMLARLLDKLADLVADHLAYQLFAGADAVQIFDSAAGVLSPENYTRVALPALRRVMGQLPKQRGPVIYFAPGAPHLLDEAGSIGADVIGLCWRSSLKAARRRLDGVALQGNLDPSALLAPPAALRARALDVLEQGRGPGHIMNLGHGILESTPLAAVETLVETVAAFRNEPAPAMEPASSGARS